MSLSTSEVSKIIEKTISISNPRELPLKGLHFGKLLFKVEEYNSAAEWILKFTRIYDRDAPAHKLLGECYERLGNVEAALSSFKRSLQIKPIQPELLLRIVELYLNPGPTQNPNKAQIWLDKATAALPGNTTVFKMKMELMLAQQASPDILEKAIVQELNRRSNDPALHVQYVSFMRTEDRLKDAYDYCNKVENTMESTSVRSDYKWSSCVVGTYKEYMEKIKGIQPLHSVNETRLILLEALSRFIWLCLLDNKQQRALEKLQIMDECLWSVLSDHTMGDWKTLAIEMEAQLWWLTATFTLQQAKKNEISWEDASNLAAVLYSSCIARPIPSSSCAWAVHCLTHQPGLPSRVQKNAATRLSQSGHMLCILSEKADVGWIGKIHENVDLSTVGKTVYQNLFGISTSSLSFLCNTKSLASLTCFVPSLDAMVLYDNVAAPSAKLDELIWLGIHWLDLDTTVDFGQWVKPSFASLQLGSGNTNASSLWSLNLLDIEAFIAACVYTTEKKAQAWNNVTLVNKQQLSCTNLPPSMCRKLTTELQDKWWEAALKLANKKKSISVDEATTLKSILQRGLECIRGVSNHGLEPVLITKLAKYFASKAFVLQQDTGTSSTWFLYQRRAALYWSLVLPDLIKFSDGKIIHQSKTKERLFPYIFMELSPIEATSLVSEAYMCHGELAAQENRFEDALCFYGKATIPEASFCQAHLYRQMAEKAAASNEMPLYDMEQKRDSLMRKHRRCLEITLSRLQQYPDENLHARTVRLFTSPQHSPIRNTTMNTTSANRSDGESIIVPPSKQSTPKMNETSHSILSGVSEKDKNVLVDTISSLTSALSNLQMEMGYLREEQNRNYMNYYNQPHGTPSHIPSNGTPMAHSFAPNMHSFQTDRMMSPNNMSLPQNRVVQNQFTPQRQFAPLGQGYLPARVTTPVLNRPLPGQIPFIDPYQQQSQATYYSPAISSPYVPAYQPEQPKYLPNYQPVPQQSYTPDTYKNIRQPTNLLSQCLQGIDTEKLQQKLSQSLSSSPALSTVGTVPVQTEPSKASNNIFNASAIVKPAAVSPTVRPITPTPTAKLSLVEKLLLDDKQSTRTIQTPTIAPPKKDFQFLSEFVSPKNSEMMKFQSPEQMDRENQELDALEQADAENASKNDTGPHFEPIIELPDIVEVCTGEEQEQVIFQERCKLYRWDNGEWKERGIGDIKLLKHETTRKARLVMRREQVLKVCCNHYILSSTHLKPMANSDKAMIWHAIDFSDESAKNEQLAARFKTPDIAQKFRDAVNKEAQNAASASTSSDFPRKESVSTVSICSSTSTSTSATPSFKFKLREPTKPENEHVTSKPPIFGGLAAALQSGFGGTGSEGGIKPGAFKFSFGSPKPKDILPAEVKTDDSKDNDDRKSPSPHLDTSNDPHFDPIVKLPDHVDVGTGEENEEVLFCSRAKLYRYADGQWKERGLGEMKILRHKTNDKYRIVMRREQVLKLCANHYIHTGMQIKPYGETGKAWSWSANDFADTESEPHQEVFAVRFKTVEQANDFEINFKQGTSRTSGKVTGLPIPTSPSCASAAFARQQEEKKKQEKSSDPMVIPKVAGTWTCPDCYASNGAKHLACPCCGAAGPNKPDVEPDTKKESAPKYKFGAPSGTINTSSSTTFKFGQQMDTTKRSTSSCLESILLGQNTFTTTTASIGSAEPQKAAESWNCPDCYVTNPCGVSQCPCCNAYNPNVPAKPKDEQVPVGQPFSFKFGVDLTKPAQSGSFKFGSPQATNQEQVKGHSALQRTGQNPMSSGFSFKFGTGNNISTVDSGKPPSQTSQPRFPSIQSDNEDEGSSSSDDNGDESTSESEGSYEYDDEYDDDDDNVDDGDNTTHQSPMSKFTTQKKTEAASTKEEEVVCLGELLPSTELQEKAKNLQLPPHFYNYLKPGEQPSSSDDGDSNSDTEKPEKENPKNGTPPNPTTTSTETTQSATSGFAFGNTTTSGLKSFAQLAANSGSGFSFGVNLPTPTTQSTWASDNKPMFPAATTSSNDNSGLYQDEERDDIEFEPIVKLPDSFVMITGEEGERTIYSQRSKLYRWDKDAKQWKERGIGDICIKHNTSSGKFRILMRREQVLKVCANHYITAKMKLEPKFDSDRTWTWTAADFSDGESTEMQNFALRFKTSQQANEFKDKFEECQVLIDDTNSSICSVSKENATNLINQAEKMKSELDFFKDKLSMKQKIDLENTLTEGTGVSSLPRLPNLTLTPLVKQHQKAKEISKSTSSTHSNDDQDIIKETSAAKPENKEQVSNRSLSLNKFEFNMKVDTKVERKTRNISVCSSTSIEEADVHFEPIIPLPEIVDVVTGEENDQVLFESRSKLFVFDRESKQWKERGLGKIRVLQNVNFKIRLVMRREQVLKVCLNQMVTDGINFNFKENCENVLIWTATDFSEHESKPNGELLQFAIRFKTAEIAASFLSCIEDGRKAHAAGKLLDPVSINNEHEAENSDVQHTSVDTESESNKATPEQKSPVKSSKPLFSFANLDSPFGLKNKPMFNDLAFGTPKSQASGQAGKYNFDASSISFNFGSTSTPATTAPPMFKQPALMNPKPSASKSLFGSDVPDNTDHEKPTVPVFGKPHSDFQFGMAAAGSTQKPKEFESEKVIVENCEKEAVFFKGGDGDDVDDDVIFVWEAVPTKQQLELATELKLPPTFFMYQDDPNLEDTNSDEEDGILEYIRLRDDPENHILDAEYSANARCDTSTSEPEESSICKEESRVESTGNKLEGGNLFAGFGATSTYSFSSMAATANNNNAFGVRKDAAFTVTAQQSMLFSGAGEDTDAEAYDPEYKPVLAQPPPLIEVKTGEEDEEVLFKERSKMYRFDSNTNAWKERGLGEIKILHHPVMNIYRVVMRREQVLKVCANHLITPDMKLMSNTDKAWMYVAQNKSDGDAVLEKLTVKFKTPQISMQFKSIWEDCQSKMKS